MDLPKHTLSRSDFLRWMGSLGLFNGRVLSTTKVGETDAMNTEVTGSAHITGFHQFVIDPDDPLRNGFLIEEV